MQYRFELIEKAEGRILVTESDLSVLRVDDLVEIFVAQKPWFLISQSLKGEIVVVVNPMIPFAIDKITEILPRIDGVEYKVESSLLLPHIVSTNKVPDIVSWLRQFEATIITLSGMSLDVVISPSFRLDTLIGSTQLAPSQRMLVTR